MFTVLYYKYLLFSRLVYKKPQFLVLLLSQKFAGGRGHSIGVGRGQLPAHQVLWSTNLLLIISILVCKPANPTRAPNIKVVTLRDEPMNSARSARATARVQTRVRPIRREYSEWKVILRVLKKQGILQRHYHNCTPATT